MRVNARFDAEAEAQVAYLSQVTGMGVSEVLRTSVQHYYDAVRARQTGLRHLSAFIGQGDSGRADVASTYKDRLTEGWGAKHGAPQGLGARPAGHAAQAPAAAWSADAPAPQAAQTEPEPHARKKSP